MVQPRSRAQVALWLLILVVVTAGLVTVRPSLERVHVALAYLLLVLIASSRAGHTVGVALSIAAFLCFNFFFLQPYYTLAVAGALDWLVLVAFLVTSLVAARLLARARDEAAAAQHRSTEVERLSVLGAETLNAARPEDALFAITDVIRSTLKASRCEVYVLGAPEQPVVLTAQSGDASSGEVPLPFGRPASHRLVQWVAEHGLPMAELLDGSIRTPPTGDAGVPPPEMDLSDARALLMPLRVRAETVGVLRVSAAGSLALHESQRRFLDALAYYAALGVDRLRLTADADRAETWRRADELKDALLASVSHDLRTPLTTIKGLAHVIAREGDDRAMTIEEEADRLNHLVTNLLDLSRISGGALHLTPEINAAEDLIGATLQRVSGTARDREVVASLDPTEVLLLGRFDFAHSLRILANLTENALKYTAANSSVELQARRADEWLEFVVADRGPGIPDDERDHIFEPFYQGGQSHRRPSGAGLGLSIARSLAVVQGGSLRYEPRAGGGSLFILRLPAAELADLSV
jgi:two-component system, OmpR family, sensor histidine kinase KdpD